MADNLHIYEIHFIAAETAALEMGVKVIEQSFVHDIPVFMIDGIIYMRMTACIHVKEHLVIGTQAVVINSQQSQLGQDIVD